MSTELTAFEDRVKQRLKEVVASLIPEDRLDLLTRQVVKEFEEKALPDLIRAELRKKYQEWVNLEFGKPEWQPQWDGSKQVASEMVRKIIVESSGDILQGIIGHVVQQMMYDIQTKVRGY